MLLQHDFGQHREAGREVRIRLGCAFQTVAHTRVLRGVVGAPIVVRVEQTTIVRIAGGEPVCVCVRAPG